MTSRERLLAALRRQDVDYVPCCPAFFRHQPQTEGIPDGVDDHHFPSSSSVPAVAAPSAQSWQGRADSLDAIVLGLGLDYHADIIMAPSWHPDTTVRLWREPHPSTGEPVLWKEIGTPGGPLRAGIRITEDLEHKGDIPLCSDFNVSRYVKPWLETMEDVERFRYVQLPATAGDVAQVRDQYAAQKRVADRYGIATMAWCGAGLSAAVQMFGATQAVLLSMDQPEVIQRFLEIEHQATLSRVEILADLGVDIIMRNGYYETTDFWSRRQIVEWVLPILRAEIEAAKSRGAIAAYSVMTGIMPILDLYADLDYDAYRSIEPVCTGQDMQAVASMLCHRHAIWGGVSAAMHIGEGTTDEVRQAVRDAFALFGPRGLVLHAANSFRAYWPWENALAMLDEWRRLRSPECWPTAAHSNSTP